MNISSIIFQWIFGRVPLSKEDWKHCKCTHKNVMDCYDTETV